jgi:hypothetical protein
MSSGLENRSEWNQQVDNRRAAPEGLPEFSKLLDQSAKVKKQLHDLQATYKYLNNLAADWDGLYSSLEDVCVALRTMNGSTTNDDLRSSDVLGDEPTTDTFLMVFAYDPVNKNSPKALVKKHEEALGRLPNSEQLRSNLNDFWNLWLRARDEIADKGPAVENWYKPFFLANSRLDGLERNFEWEIDGMTLSFEDAKTIDACLPEPNAQDTGSYESESAYKLLKYLKTKGCQGYSSAELQADAAEGDTAPIAPSSGINSLMTPEVSDFGLESLDITILQRHVTPKLRVVNHQLIRSLQNASNKFATEAIQVRQRGVAQPVEAWRLNQLLRTAELFKALGDTVQRSLSSASSLSEAAAPSTTTSGLGEHVTA